MKKSQNLPSCPYCLQENLKLISTAAQRQIYQCQKCQLVSAAKEIFNGRLSPQALARLKTKEYQKKTKKWHQAYLQEKDSLLARFDKRLQEIEKRKKPGKILDIGCAAGFFLESAQKHGWQVYGIDTNKEAINHCQKLVESSRLFQGTLEKANFKPNFFDVITLFEVLEHMPDLQAFLAETKRILKPQGLLALNVPNRAGVVSRLLGQHWFDYKRLQHLYFFSPQTLKMVLKKNDFKIIFEKQEIFY